MNPFYYKYIDPIIDYLQPLPKIVGDPVVIGVVILFIAVLGVWYFEYKNSEE